MKRTAGEVLPEIWGEVLGLSHVESDQNFFDVGGDSLLAIRLISRCREAGLLFSATDVFTLQTLAQLIDHASAPPRHAPIPTGSGTTHPLLPSQQRWIQGPIADINHFNLGWLFNAPASITRDGLCDAVQIVLDRNGALRTSYRKVGSTWEAHAVPPSVESVIVEPELDDYRVDAAALSQEMSDAQKSMNLNDGQVFRVVHFPFGNEPGRLLILAHHLTLDGFSTSLLADEMETALLSVLKQGSPVNSATTASIPTYADCTMKWCETPEAAEDLETWLKLPWNELGDIPWSPQGEGRLPSMRTLTGSLSPANTARVRAVAAKHNLNYAQILLGAALGAISEWTGNRLQGADVYHHGRDTTPLNVNVTRTIGYIQNTCPVFIEWVGEKAGFDWVASVADQVGKMPRRHFGFDALQCYGSTGNESLRSLPPLQIRYNFRGHMNRLNTRPSSLLRPAPESIGPHRSPAQTEKYRLMLEGDVVEDTLVFGIKYSQDFYNAETIKQLIARTISLLEG